MKKYIAVMCIVLALSLLFAGCGHRTSGIYSEEEMGQIHDITSAVEQWSVAYDNVIDNSIPSTVTGKLASGDKDYLNYISTAGIDPDKPMVALTFDDGPNPNGGSTSDILDVLEQYDARATFFVVGSNVTDGTSNLIKRMNSLGCEIGSHTYNHTDLTTLDAAGIRDELDKTNEAVSKYTGSGCSIMRPPGGAVNDTVRASVDVPMILWYVDTRDWESRDASSVISNVETYVQDGAIVLMHDIYDSTAQAVATVVPYLINQGYQLVTVSQLAYLKGVTLEAGGEYFDFIKGDNSNIVPSETTAEETQTETEDSSADSQDDGSDSDSSQDGSSGDSDNISTDDDQV